MEIKNNEKLTETLVINKVPSKKIFNQMIEQGLVNDDELYVITDNETPFYKYNIKCEKGQSSFTIPFDLENTETINIYYNGLLMINEINYQIENKTVNLLQKIMIILLLWVFKEQQLLKFLKILLPVNQ